MRPVRAALLALLVGSFAIGASCDGNQSDEAPGGGSNSAPPSNGNGASVPIEELAPVDVSALQGRDRARWVELVNDFLAPCGQPISVAKCVAEERPCKDCVPAARYLVRLVQEGYEHGEIEQHFRLRYASDAKHEIDTAGAPVWGSPMAPVTIVEFSDFECPFCADAHPMLKQIVKESDGKVRLVFKHYPLEQHTHARLAAKAAIAAAKQDKFWEMHDKLFENRDRLEKPDLVRYADAVGLDVAQFKQDLESEATERRLEQDKAEGRKLKVQGTPSIFVNGRRFEEPLRVLPAYVQEELDR